MSDMFWRLKEPFDPSVVSWRVGSTNQEKTKGIALAYIDARDVMKRLDEVAGPANWQDEYHYFGDTAICYISIHIGDGVWIKKGDGAGDTQVEAEKGRISDAFKRAAVKWGIVRYLYDLDSPWVMLVNKRIADSEMPRLAGLLGKQYKPPGKLEGRLADDPNVQADMKANGYDPTAVYNTVIDELNRCEDSDMLAEWVKVNKITRRMQGLPSDLKDDVTTSYNKLKTHFMDKGNN